MIIFVNTITTLRGGFKMEKFVQVAHANVAYTAKGEGPGILLIHGTGGSYESTWGNVIESLSGQYKIVAPNFSGSGHTKDDGNKLDLNDLVEQNVQAALQENLDKFHVVGYSLGAVVAAAVAARYPERVKSATLVAGWVESTLAVSFQFDLWQKLYYADPLIFAQFLIHTGFGPGFYNNFGNLDELLQLAKNFKEILGSGTGRQSELDGRINIRPFLNQIIAPTLVVGMTHDRMVPVENVKELASLIKGARYEEIASGHLVPWENSAAFVNAISSFIKSI